MTIDQVKSALESSYKEDKYGFVSGDGLAETFRGAMRAAEFSNSFSQNAEMPKIAKAAEKYLKLPTTASKSVISKIESQMETNLHLDSIESMKDGVAVIRTGWKGYGDTRGRTSEYAFRKEGYSDEKYRAVWDGYNSRAIINWGHKDPQQQLANEVITRAWANGVRITKVISHEYYD